VQLAGDWARHRCPRWGMPSAPPEFIATGRGAIRAPVFFSGGINLATKTVAPVTEGPGQDVGRRDRRFGCLAVGNRPWFSRLGWAGPAALVRVLPDWFRRLCDPINPRGCGSAICVTWLGSGRPFVGDLARVPNAQRMPSGFKIPRPWRWPGFSAALLDLLDSLLGAAPVAICVGALGKIVRLKGRSQAGPQADLAVGPADCPDKMLVRYIVLAGNGLFATRVDPLLVGRASQIGGIVASFDGLRKFFIWKATMAGRPATGSKPDAWLPESARLY